MNDLITPQIQIKEELKTMQSDIEVEASEDAEEAVFRGNKLAAYMARSGKLSRR